MFQFVSWSPKLKKKNWSEIVILEYCLLKKYFKKFLGWNCRFNRLDKWNQLKGEQFPPSKFVENFHLFIYLFILINISFYKTNTKPS